MKYLFILLMTLYFTTGCTSVLRVSYGIKSPKIQDKKSIFNFLSKKGIDTTGVLIFKDLNSFKEAKKMKLLTIPNAFFFNGNGDFVDYKKTPADCNAKIDGFIEDLTAMPFLRSDPSFNINTLLPLVARLDQKPISQGRISVVITWAIYAGRLNDEKVFNWVKLINLIKEKKNVEVDCFLLNCDLQKSWDYSNNDAETLHLKQ